MSTNKHIRISLMSISSIMLEETTKDITETLKANGTDLSNASVADTLCTGQAYTNTIDILDPPSKAIEALMDVRLPEEVEISLDIIPESKLKC